MSFPRFLTFLPGFDSTDDYIDPQLLVNAYSSPTYGVRIFINNASLLFIAL